VNDSLRRRAFSFFFSVRFILKRRPTRSGREKHVPKDPVPCEKAKPFLARETRQPENRGKPRRHCRAHFKTREQNFWVALPCWVDLNTNHIIKTRQSGKIHIHQHAWPEKLDGSSAVLHQLRAA